MAGKQRKPGDWKAVVAGRAKVEREIHNGRGLSNVPNLNETGSAAYRRSQRKGKQ